MTGAAIDQQTLRQLILGDPPLLENFLSLTDQKLVVCRSAQHDIDQFRDDTPPVPCQQWIESKLPLPLWERIEVRGIALIPSASRS